MTSQIKLGCIATLAAMAWALSGRAAEPSTDSAGAGPSGRNWTLATEDTEVSVTATEHGIGLVGLRNPGRAWNWIAAPCPVPMPSLDGAHKGGAVLWQFRGATEEAKHGRQVTLRFTCDHPAMELKSVWRALPGPGPVENEVTVENRSQGDVVFPPTLVAAKVDLAADGPVTMHRARKTNVGIGEVLQDVIGPRASFTTDTSVIPLIILGVGDKHGAYLGYEWELGGFRVTSGADPRRFAVSVHPITEKVARPPGGTFLIPSVYYGVYQGDIDDGSNRFKRWFWNHKITRSLHDNQDEPWTEMCVGNGGPGTTGASPQSYYDRIAATGVECVKLDFWDGTGQCWYTDRDWMFHPKVWPNEFDYGAKAHKAGMKASLYMGGTYKDADLTTIAGRDAELKAVLSRYDQGWFDIWRTDRYTAPNDPIPPTYEGVTNFLYIQDYLIKHRPGYRYENCCNGGKYKGLAICRRMTFCTMNDDDNEAWKTRTTYYSNSFAINPVQLKSDHRTRDAYDMRTDIMGSILTQELHDNLWVQYVALYKTRQRAILRGCNVYHILPMADGTNWDGLEYYNPDLDRGSVVLFKPSRKAPGGDSKVVKLKGLDRKATFTLTFQERTRLNGSRTGAQLMDEGITVSGMTGDRASEIIWIEGPVGRKQAGSG